MIKLSYAQLNTVYSACCKYILFGSLVLLLFSSCSFYRTISVDQITPNIVEDISSSDKIMVIHNSEESEEYLFTHVIIENRILKGYTEPAPKGGKHIHHKKTFLRCSAKAYKPLM